MKKVSYLTIALIILISGAVFARDAVGHISIDDPVPNSNLITPELSYTMPQDYRRAIVLESPTILLRFFESKGISPEDLNAKSFSLDLKAEICSICEDCCDEFGNVLINIASQYRATHFEVYIVKVGDMYWSFYA